MRVFPREKNLLIVILFFSSSLTGCIPKLLGQSPTTGSATQSSATSGTLAQPIAGRGIVAGGGSASATGMKVNSTTGEVAGPIQQTATGMRAVTNIQGIIRK